MNAVSSPRVVILSRTAIVAIILLAVVLASAVGLWHDQSIKSIYASFAIDKSQLDTLYTNQIQLLQAQTKFTFVHGTVEARGGTPVSIFFDSESSSSLSSGVRYSSNQFTYTYQVYLKASNTYGVRIVYSGVLSGGSCAGVPVLVTPTGVDFVQNFQC